MWVEADPENRITSMGRATAFPASIATVMLGRGEIKSKGLVAPEDAFDEQLYRIMMQELGGRGIYIEEVIK